MPPAVSPASDGWVRPPEGDGSPLTIRRLLLDRNFGPYFVGSLANNMGTWFHSIASVLVVYELTDSTLAVGVVSGSQFAATMVLGPTAGRLLDHMDRRLLMAVAQIGSAVAAAALVVASVSGRLSVPVVLGATAVIGVGEAFSVPTKQALVPSLVRSADIGQALALQSFSFNIARSAGPALGALVVTVAGPAWAFGVNFASYLVLMGALAIMQPRPVQPTSGDRSFRAGLRYVRGHRPILLNLVGLAAISFALDPVTTVAPALVEDLGGGRNLVGLLVSAFGCGAALMALFGVRQLQRRAPLQAGTIGLTTFGAAMLAVAAAPNPPAVITALTFAGAGFLLANNDLTTRIQRSVDEHLRGRVLAIWAMVLLGTRPVAGVVSGSIADATSARLAILLPACLVLAAARVTWKNRALPDGAASMPAVDGYVRPTRRPRP